MTPLSHTDKPVTLGSIAQTLGGECFGNANYEVTAFVDPRMCRSDKELVYAIEPAAFGALGQLPAKAAVVSEGMVPPESFGLEGYVVVKRPRYALAGLLEIFNKPVHYEVGVHPSAVVHPTAQVAEGVSIGAFVFVGENVKIGPRTVLLPHVTVGAECQLGEDCLIHPGTRLGERTVLKNRVVIHQNASIGGDGFVFVTPEAGSIETARATNGKIEAQNTEIVRINSVGSVLIEDDVEIGSCTTIDRATLGVTVVKKGTKIDNLVMIGHNNTIGENCLIVAHAGISGSCKIGDRVVVAGQVGIKDHTKVGNDSIIMAKSGVMRDIGEKEIMMGIPAMPQREFFKRQAYLGRIGGMSKTLKALQSRLESLETELATLKGESAPPHTLQSTEV